MQSLIRDFTRNEIMEGKMGEEEREDDEEQEEAAFCAEAEAFSRKNDVHETAIRRLMQDLLEEEEEEEENNETDALRGMQPFMVKKTVMTGTMDEENYAKETLTSMDDFVEKKKNLMNEALKDEEEENNGKKAFKSMKFLLNNTMEATKTQVIFDVEKGQKKMKGFFNQTRKSTLNHLNKSGLKFGYEDNIAEYEHETSHFAYEKKNPDLCPYFINLAKRSISANKPGKALYFSNRALKSLKVSSLKPNLDAVMYLHDISSIQCSLGHYEEAIKTLQRSIYAIDVEKGGHEHALASFATYMQLGDIFAFLGKYEESFTAYQSGFEFQIGAIGKIDRRVGETCRYLAEAHTKALQFDKAEEFCRHALEIDRECNAPLSIEELSDRRLMSLICNEKGDHEAALEHLLLASMALMANNKKHDAEMAAVNASIGDTYVSLGRFDEAILAYLKALTIFKAFDVDKDFVAVAGVYVSLADLYLKKGKRHESRTYCDSAMSIYNKARVRNEVEEVARGLSEVAIVYEGLDEHNKALCLLQKALDMLGGGSCGIEAQIGVLHYLHGDYEEALSCFNRVVAKMRNGVEKRSSLFGIVLNQMGLVHVQFSEIQFAIELFEESVDILEGNLGLHHPDTLMVYGNLSNAYDAVGRLDDAIAVLEYTLESRGLAGKS